MFVLFRGYDNETFSSVVESMVGMFRMSLGAFGEIYETFDETIDDPVYKWFPQVHSARYKHALRSPHTLLILAVYHIRTGNNMITIRLSVFIQRFNAVLLHGCFVDEVAGHSS